VKLCESFGETVEESLFVEYIRVKRIDRARSLFVILLKEHLSSIAIKNGNVFLPCYHSQTLYCLNWFYKPQ